MAALVFAINEMPHICEMPALTAERFAADLADQIKGGWRLLALWGCPEGQDIASLFAVLEQGGRLCALRSVVLKDFPSIAEQCPQAQLFEREIYESCGVLPRKHPWLKPVRTIPDSRQPAHNADYGFFRVHGGQSHEVAVGPIHAGIIEPGHFRFNCYGEIVLSLEIALGYQHRGIERQLLTLPLHARSLRQRLVECIAGDSSVAYATAYCETREKLLQYGQLPEHALRQRRLGLELERLACHCGDLGAIAGDTGFLPTSSWNGRIRGDFLNLTAALCGNRFGREYLLPGGVVQSLDRDQYAAIAGRLAQAGQDATGSCKAMFASASVCNRMRGTGSLTKEQALELGLVGVAARACGISCDMRYAMPPMAMPHGIQERLESTGDVYARAAVRFGELQDALAIAGADLAWLSRHGGAKDAAMPERQSLPVDTLAVSLVESWRGAVCHAVITGTDSTLRSCKFVDPSFHNWAGLSLAMRDGQISDFPLCNKSFNLSYCGHDL